MKGNRQRTAKARKYQEECLTQKKLEFLLPSSKQIMLINSSIKYNTTHCNQSSPKDQQEISSSRVKMPSQNKENEAPEYKTSILGTEDRLAMNLECQEIHLDVNPQKGKEFKIVAQTYNKLQPTHTSTNVKPFSSVYVSHYEDFDQKHLTSLNNIVAPGESEFPNAQTNSKEDLVKRVSKLEKLVHDLLSGKIALPRTVQYQSQRKISLNKGKKDSSKEIEAPVKRKEKRCATWSKDLNGNAPASLKFSKSKAKIKIDSSLQLKKEPQPPATIPVTQTPPKTFIVKKKNALKLTTNYQPIRQATAEFPKIQNTSKYVSPITQSNERNTFYSKLKLKVNLMPNIVNL